MFDFFSVLRARGNAFIGFHDPNEDKMYVWLNGNPTGSNVEISNFGGGGKHITELTEHRWTFNISNNNSVI